MELVYVVVSFNGPAMATTDFEQAFTKMKEDIDGCSVMVYRAGIWMLDFYFDKQYNSFCADSDSDADKKVIKYILLKLSE
ncbi:hypothetical protein [Bacillus sp. XF8]|uniref:hypothetical protein n=1 Tax=Bacillus sp. XF8 TaxID=2819289 RepID=UPI001AA08C96|nr:hypothetical protein [Bacillus sp. XF8]MBO1583138.1 hypothetical protein [Bacillus sp. XF8]